MRTLIRTALCGQLFAVALAGTADAEPSALQMRSGCRSAFADDSVNVHIAWRAGHCVGAFEALHTSLMLGQITAPEMWRACPSVNATTRELADIFVRYVDAHPHRLHQGWFFVALSALQEAFPCDEP